MTAFRLFVGNWLYHAETLSSFAPDFDDCGATCGETGETLNKFCDDCPVKLEKDSFDDLTANALKEKFGKSSHPSLSDLKKNLYLLLDLEDLPLEKRSVKTHKLLQILNAERNRKQRIERFNRTESD